MVTIETRNEREVFWLRSGYRIASLLFLAALFGVACGCFEGPDSRPNVILIVVDTLRADRANLGGYDRDTTPGLVRMAEEGLTLQRFYSHSSWTRASIATLFSSHLPSGNGVVHSGHSLRSEVGTLPEILREAGYSTLAFVANPQIHPKLGFAQGIDRLFEPEWWSPRQFPDRDPRSLGGQAVLERRMP